jgi:putative nucleotidyltransferase with HDIG domain
MSEQEQIQIKKKKKKEEEKIKSFFFRPIRRLNEKRSQQTEVSSAQKSSVKRLLEMHIDPYVAKLLKDISKVSTPYIVGGSVRDFLMSKDNYDYDIAVKDFDEVVKHLISLGYNVSTEAKSFRVVKVTLENGEVVDVAGFRTEEYDLVSRKPKVAPAETIEQDLSRRDFTINAMAIRVDNVSGDKLIGALIDPFDGLKDLERGIIRAVRSPVARIMEDPLRILRALRFAVKFRFKIDPELMDAIKSLHGELKRVSAERIREELEKMFLIDPAESLRLIYESDVWRTIMSFIGRMAEVKHDYRGHHHGETVLEHTIESLRNLKKLHNLNRYNVLAVLLHDIGKPEVVKEADGKIMFIGHEEVSAEIAREWLREMRYDNKTVKIVSDAIRIHEKIHHARGNRGALAKIWVEDANEDPEVMEIAIEIAEADKGERYDDVRQMIEEFKKIPRPRGELVLHLPPEKRGKTLKKLRIIQLRDRITDVEKLKKILRGITI